MKRRYKLHWETNRPKPSLRWVIYDWKLIYPVFYTESRVIGRKVCELLNKLSK